MLLKLGFTVYKAMEDGKFWYRLKRKSFIHNGLNNQERFIWKDCFIITVQLIHSNGLSCCRFDTCTRVPTVESRLGDNCSRHGRTRLVIYLEWSHIYNCQKEQGRCRVRNGTATENSDRLKSRVCAALSGETQ